jgi:hypothetical protein
MASEVATAEQVENLRNKFIVEAEKARKARNIGPLEFMRCKRVWRKWDKPCPDEPEITVGEAVADEIAYQLCAAGLVASPEAIDWENIDWEKLFKIILDFIAALIAMFGL